MGIGVTKLGKFLETFSFEVEWDILLLQEFTGARNVAGFMNEATHRVILAAPVEGSRACGIVINQRIKHCMIKDSEYFKPRATSVCIHWEGWNIKLISGHLSPDHNKDRYTQSIVDIQNIINYDTRDKFINTPHFDKDQLRGPIYRIIGIDAQVSVGQAHTREESSLIGPAVMKDEVRHWKTHEFIHFILEEKLTLFNTFSKNTQDIFTCGYFLKSPPNQIDYTLTDMPGRTWGESGVHQSEASLTDHRATFGIFTGKWWRKHEDGLY